MTTVQQTAIDWAQEHGTPFYYQTALDNHSPERTIWSGLGWHYEHPDPNVHGGVLLEGLAQWRNGHQCGYLLDDGATVLAYYVAAWHAEHNYLLLHRLPVGPNHASWRLGPRRFYHLITGGTDR